MTARTRVATPAPASAAALPARGFALTWDQVEAGKWLAAASMLADHVGAILLDRALPVLSEVGRLAMPLFALLLGLSLARAPRDDDAWRRLMGRLLLTALLASPAFVAWHLRAAPDRIPPLDIVFGLATGVLCVRLLARPERRPADTGIALLAGLAGGAFVEFMWLAPALVVAGHAWGRSASRGVPVMIAGLLAALCVLNSAGLGYDSGAALLALPLLLALRRLPLRVPRVRHAFHVFYPLHLTLLVLLPPM